MRITDDVAVDIADLSLLVNYMFRQGFRLPCSEAGNVDGIGEMNNSDLTFLVAYLFGGGPSPQGC